MTEKRFQTSKDAKAAGWHSKRHETREAQDAAREEYQWRHGRKARQRRALERDGAGEGLLDADLHREPYE